MQDNLKARRVGVALCGSFCTFSRVFEAIEQLVTLGADVFPIMSANAAHIDTRFGKADEHIEHLTRLTGRAPIITIEGAEPLGPKRILDILLVANCTGNTLAKLAGSITDTSVTMAVKSHLRSACPVVINVATNDALAGTAKNIGQLMNYKHYFFVPLKQDDFLAKPTSIVGDFARIPETLSLALNGEQIQPIFG